MTTRDFPYTGGNPKECLQRWASRESKPISPDCPSGCFQSWIELEEQRGRSSVVEQTLPKLRT